MNDVPVWPLVIVLTVWRLSGSPFFKIMLTGPSASAQVKVNGRPAVTLLKTMLVNSTACATPAKAAAAKKRDENCILKLFERDEVPWKDCVG